jgi:hypothetical protein
MRAMLDGERLVAERHVPIHERQTLSVRISQHDAEEFWRVQVTNPTTARVSKSTTVGCGDNSFLMGLIEDAVNGQQSAWGHLAQWGQTNLTRPATGFRAAPV